MLRKVRNSLNALLLTSAICATGAFAVAAMPVAPQAAVGARPAMAVTATSDAHRKPARSSRIRHLMAVPYFSFVTRD